MTDEQLYEWANEIIETDIPIVTIDLSNVEEVQEDMTDQKTFERSKTKIPII